MVEMGMIKQSYGSPSQKASVMGTSTGGAEMRINLNKLPSQQEVVKQINKAEAVRPENKTMTELKAKQVAEFSARSVDDFDRSEGNQSGIQAKEQEVLSREPEPAL